MYVCLFDCLEKKKFVSYLEKKKKKKNQATSKNKYISKSRNFKAEPEYVLSGAHKLEDWFLT